MNILNGTEAFEAMMAGRNIMCRAAGELIAFDDLDQFPATIFSKPGYEFCIKIDTIEVAGITFTKPLTIDEYQEGQDVFVINTYLPSIYVVNFKTAALIQSINSGFVQRDAENAELQLKALSKSLGRDLDSVPSIVRPGEEPKKQRASRKKAESKVDEVNQSEINAADKTEEALITKSLIEQTEDLSVEALKKLQQDAEDQIKGVNDQVQADENRITLLNDLLERASNSQTPAEANALIKYTSEWTEEQRKPLLNAIHNRLKDISAFTTTETQPPSLMVQIQNAKDLNELECLEVEVFNRHPDIQPKLMDFVKRRRFELKNGAGPVGAPL